MRLKNSHISIGLSLLIVLGMSLSVIHNHIYEETFVDGIEYQIVQDSNECSVCASHFKVVPDFEIESDVIPLRISSLSVFSESVIIDPLFNLQDGRAPPIGFTG